MVCFLAVRRVRAVQRTANSFTRCRLGLLSLRRIPKLSHPRHGLWRPGVMLGRAGRFAVDVPFSDDVTVVIF